ncbi:MAG TPA: lipid-A-disaccharide synthase [Longimicrobiales bacterium]
MPPQRSAPRIFLSAGEPSGDHHGAALARSLRQRWPGATLYGLGGPRMAAEGVELMAHVDDLAVMGFAEVIGRLPFFINLLQQARDSLRASPPDLVIPIDYPGFNMRLARMAQNRHIPVLYYIAPQVWAWHRSRIHDLADVTDALALILPFEEKLFRDAGANAHFVGHPLLDSPPPARPRAEFCESLGLDPERPILALFPGSRRQEVERLVAPFTAAADIVMRQMPTVQTVIAAGSGLSADLYGSTKLPRTPDAWELLYHARAAVVKSGTGTLQAAIADTPLVVGYVMNPLSYLIARHVVEVPHVALVNLVADERLATELIQDAVTPEAVAAEILPLLQESPARTRALDGLARVRARLHAPAGSPGAAARVTEMAAELMAGHR